MSRGRGPFIDGRRRRFPGSDRARRAERGAGTARGGVPAGDGRRGTGACDRDGRAGGREEPSRVRVPLVAGGVPTEALAIRGSMHALRRGDRLSAARRDPPGAVRAVRERPARAVGYVHFRRTSSRCHRSRVCGVMRNEGQRSLGRTRLAAARKTRSIGRSDGRATCRRRIFTWCRSTAISTSFEASRVAVPAKSPNRLRSSAYRIDRTTGPRSYRRPGR